jgi:hypothetical protein
VTDLPTIERLLHCFEVQGRDRAIGYDERRLAVDMLTNQVSLAD